MPLKNNIPSGWVYLASCVLINNPELLSVKYGCTSLDPKNRIKRLGYEKRATHKDFNLLAVAYVPDRYRMENKIKWELAEDSISAMDETVIAESKDELRQYVDNFRKLVFSQYKIVSTLTRSGSEILGYEMV